jgi:hypothetical protein
MFSIKQGQPGDPVALRNIFKNAQAIGDLTNQETQFEQSVAESVDQKVQSVAQSVDQKVQSVDQKVQSVQRVVESVGNKITSQDRDIFQQGNQILAIERKFDFLLRDLVNRLKNTGIRL